VATSYCGSNWEGKKLVGGKASKHTYGSVEHYKTTKIKIPSKAHHMSE